MNPQKLCCGSTRCLIQIHLKTGTKLTCLYSRKRKETKTRALIGHVLVK